MSQAAGALLAAGLVLGGAAARADTALVEVTPKSIKRSTFTLKSKHRGKDTVEFVIRRDVTGITDPSRAGYLSNTAVDRKGLGTPVKQEVDGNIWTFRFSVPEDQVETSRFTLWGGGLRGEGVTYRFQLAQFRKPARG